MKQYNLDFYDEDQKYPCTYIREHGEKLFEGFYRENSIGIFTDFKVAARRLGLMARMEMWFPSDEEYKRPN